MPSPGVPEESDGVLINKSFKKKKEDKKKKKDVFYLEPFLSIDWQISNRDMTDSSLQSAPLQISCSARFHQLFLVV